MKYTKQQLTDYFEWDIRNWSKALRIWDKKLSDNGLRCLELGSRGGGLSLWLAKKGNIVICSDLENPKEEASILHKKNLSDTNLISYEAIDATQIPYTDYFDIVIFKSVMGGVGRDDNLNAQKEMISQIHKALKKGGSLLFIENLTGSRIHRFFRKRFIKWASYWRYIKISEMKDFLSVFSDCKLKTCGYFGAFGRTNNQRNFLSAFDTVFADILFPAKSRYIVYGIAEK